MKAFLAACALLISVPAMADEMFPGDTYLESLTAAVADNWHQYGLSPEKDRDYFDCLVNEAVKSFTPAEMGRLDVYADTRNPDLIPEVNAIVANRDARVGNDIRGYVLGKCQHLAN